MFTLGEENIDLLDQIKTLNSQVTILHDRKNNYLRTFESKKQELDQVELFFQSKCWRIKQKYDDHFAAAFKGYRNSAKKFKDKILHESVSNHVETKDILDLKKKAAALFTEDSALENLLPVITSDELSHCERNPLLGKPIIGKGDVNISEMIEKLNNTDWVKAGRAFFDLNDKHCPFCQQKAPESLSASLANYFDESYDKEILLLESLITRYKTACNQILSRLEEILTASSIFLDKRLLEAQTNLLRSRIKVNYERLEIKKKEPSRKIELEYTITVISSLKTLINEANVKITEHNAIVQNVEEERQILIDEVWQYILITELKDELTSYKSKKSDLEKAISNLCARIRVDEKTISANNRRIQELERGTTSTQPTIDGINSLLSSFGTPSFSLAKSKDGKNYVLTRPDGTDAKDTLSDGEKAYISFLYFYYRLKGSFSESGISSDRVVVFDDPVSSLDSDTLFIVSNLIKKLFDEVRNDYGGIKQIFILTHNIYFHKEITFNKCRTNGAMKEETFWIIRRNGPKSTVEKYDSNPIKTSYELLWSEVRRENRSNLAIQNTLRRILENYFKILGGIDSDDICDQFDGHDKLICKSLFSWINDGSHYADDDLYISINDSDVDKYLNVFKSIFNKLGHTSHYEMMMQESFLTEVPM